MGITMEELRESRRARGPATILAIGTAVPDHYIYQADYPDYYFRLTSSEHMTKLKEKFTRICQKTMIRKRHFVLTEELLKDNPMDICSHDSPSLNVRQDIMVDQLPRLGAEAASKAIDEWGQPKSKITHLVFCATVAGELPGTDYKLVKLLGLNPTVKRVMLYQQGCFSGGSVLRIAKDLAENNANARVLVVCSQSTAILFRGPSERSLGSLVGQAIFGDGASSVIIGSDPREPIERPIFQIVFTAETIIPDSGDSITAQLCEAGLVVDLSERVPYLLSENIERIITDAFNPIGIDDWNSIFWAPHPGGPKILDQVEAKFGLNKDKFRASRHILGEYGNMSSVCVLFILDDIRKRSKEEKLSTTGEGLEWGVLLGFGPGITVETIVLRSIPT